MEETLFTILKNRGYIYQCTNMDKVQKLLEEDKSFTFYLGIDPTADSLHIGHFFALMMFRYLQDAGHRGIIVIGGATALVGDPSGRSDMRKMLTATQVKANIEEVKKLIKNFVKTDGENPAIILDNSTWINSYNYVDFMRLVGVHFNVNVMLATESYANRLKEGGLTFLEMGYMLMQAYDFVYLNQEYGCVLQIGGSDQWGNIVAGTSLYRKMQFLNSGKNSLVKNNSNENSEVSKIDSEIDNEIDNEIFGLTCPLLLTKDGRKMGKTASGTLWVARDKTTSFDFYQYFYNVDDGDVEMLLKLFTTIPLKEIQELCSSDIIKAKRTMAFEITKLVHGKEEADKALAVAKDLFSTKTLTSKDIPTSDYKISESINVLDLFYNSRLVSSKGEARRLIMQEGAYIDDKVCNDINAIITKPIDKDFVLLRKGKKIFLKVYFN
ncbi:MAG: tyrosine--tRNA ligase [Bdellovibrionota bacterium]